MTLYSKILTIGLIAFVTSTHAADQATLPEDRTGLCDDLLTQVTHLSIERQYYEHTTTEAAQRGLLEVLMLRCPERVTLYAQCLYLAGSDEDKLKACNGW